MSDYVMAHSWDPPQLTQHFATYHNQIVGNDVSAPWVKTLCGRSLLANGEHENTEMCEECEEGFDEAG